MAQKFYTYPSIHYQGMNFTPASLQVKIWPSQIRQLPQQLLRRAAWWPLRLWTLCQPIPTLRQLAPQRRRRWRKCRLARRQKFKIITNLQWLRWPTRNHFIRLCPSQIPCRSWLFRLQRSCELFREKWSDTWRRKKVQLEPGLRKNLWSLNLWTFCERDMPWQIREFIGFVKKRVLEVFENVKVPWMKSKRNFKELKFQFFFIWKLEYQTFLDSFLNYKPNNIQ